MKGLSLAETACDSPFLFFSAPPHGLLHREKVVDGLGGCFCHAGGCGQFFGRGRSDVRDAAEMVPQRLPPLRADPADVV